MFHRHQQAASKGGTNAVTMTLYTPIQEFFQKATLQWMLPRFQNIKQSKHVGRRKKMLRAHWHWLWCAMLLVWCIEHIKILTPQPFTIGLYEGYPQECDESNTHKPTTRKIEMIRVKLTKNRFRKTLRFHWWRFYVHWRRLHPFERKGKNRKKEKEKKEKTY